MNNILTFDLEDWYHGNFLDNKNQVHPVDRIVEPTLKIIDILRKTSNKATFFGSPTAKVWAQLFSCFNDKKRNN